MYCPQCGANNEPKQSFCRQCGQSLVSVQLAVEGRVDEVIAKFSKAEDLLAGGLLTFAIFVLGGLVSLLIGGLVPFAISIGLGFIICLPIVIKGLMRVDHLGRLLDPKKTSSDTLLKDTGRPAELLAAKPTDPLDASLPAPGSVTDHTTLNLKTPQPK
jgi:hypothetical protein